MAIAPGLILAIVLAFGGQFLSDFIGVTLMGLPKSPISAIMMAILLGIIVRNTITLPVSFQPGLILFPSPNGASLNNIDRTQ